MVTASKQLSRYIDRTNAPKHIRSCIKYNLIYLYRFISYFSRAMADVSNDSLRKILTDCQVQDTFSDAILEQGWTLEHFAMLDFEADLPDVLGGVVGALVPFQKAALRLAWTRCKQHQDAPSPPQLEPAAASSDTGTSGSWTESFAPKLTSSVVASLKSSFKRNYPAEILTADNTPSLRLLSMIHHQHAKKDHKWVPWKFRLSQQRSDEVASSKSGRIPKSETMSLHSMILDDPPTIEIANGGLGLHALRSLFETYSIAMSMVGVAHLASLKDYYLRFLGFMSVRLESDSGLRNPSILEAQSADKTLMGIVCDLVAERNWSWDDALHEVTHIRSEMASLLQPRPRLLKQPPLGGKGDSWTRPNRVAPYGKGDGKSHKGDGKKGKKGSKGSRVAWVTEINHGGQRHQLCMRFQVGKCSMENCRFKHVCAYPTKDGHACGKDHGALQHESTAH